MKDPSIDDVREVRRQISAEHGHDLHRLAEYYRRVEDELRRSGAHQFAEPGPTASALSPLISGGGHGARASDGR